MIVLDTNVLSELLKPAPSPAVVEWVLGLAGDVSITAITLAELLAGVQSMPAGRRRQLIAEKIETATRPYMDTQAVLPFDEHAAAHYASILVDRRALGAPISTADAQIAAICRANSAACATRNTQDFTGCGIELINPWAERA